MRTGAWCMLVATLFGVLALVGCGTSETSARLAARSSTSLVGVGPPSVSRQGSFISLWPACACGKTTVLEQFSLKDGRRLEALAKVPSGSVHVANPHADKDRGVWITMSSGPRCTSNLAGCGPAANSCSGTVVRFDPVTQASTALLVSPSSLLVTDALPSPSRRRVVITQGGCATSFFNQHLVVRELRSGRQWTIGADAAPCHALGDPAWSADGSQLVFPYGRSVLSRHAHVPGGTCEAPRLNRLVVVSAGRASRTTAWRLIRADRGCSYQAATFDRWGIAAIEGCVQGEPPGQYSVNGGNAYLVQLNHQRRVIVRVQLARGYNDGAIVNDPRTGSVLVSEYQAANQGVPVFDWVWEFNGHRLRTVHRYPNRDAATVIAEPW